MILVVASMEVELEGFLGVDKTPDYWEECKLTYTGIGRKNVDETFDSLELSSNLDGLLAVGFGGSVDPSLEPGELCLVESVASTGGTNKFCPNEDLLALARKNLSEDYRSCQLLTVDKTLSGVDEKRSLRSESCSIIDRETYWIAEIAAEKSVPFVALRTVIDGIDQDLPPEFCYDGDTGKVRPWKLASWILRSPGHLKELPWLGLNSVKARYRLAGAVNRILPAWLE